MKSPIRFASWLVPLLLLAPPFAPHSARVQGEGGQEKPALETVPKRDMKLLAGRLGKYLAEPATSSRKFDYRSGFEKELAKVEKKYSLQLIRDTAFVSELLSRASTYTHKGSSTKGRVKEYSTEEVINGKAYSAKFWLWLPKAYKQDRAWPLIVGLHPRGKDGRWYLEEILNDPKVREGYILLCPTLDEGEDWFELSGLIKLFPRSIKVVWDSYNVDRRRVFLDGYAGGGESVWKIATAFRDIFAGAVVRSASLGDDALLEGNLLHTPAYYVVGADDKDLKLDGIRKAVEALQKKHYDLTYQEVAGKGKDTFVEFNERIADWLGDKTRLDYPTKVMIRTRALQFGRGYWIDLRRIETGIDEKSRKPYVASLEAQYDRGANRIDITTENVYKLAIYLNDKIIDMDQPFQVYVNGEEAWKGTRERSWRHLIDQYNASGDSTRVYSSVLTLDINAQAETGN